MDWITSHLISTYLKQKKPNSLINIYTIKWKLQFWYSQINVAFNIFPTNSHIDTSTLLRSGYPQHTFVRTSSSPSHFSIPKTRNQNTSAHTLKLLRVKISISWNYKRVTMTWIPLAQKWKITRSQHAIHFWLWAEQKSWRTWGNHESPTMAWWRQILVPLT